MRRNFTGYSTWYASTETEWGGSGANRLRGSWTTNAQRVYPGMAGKGYSDISTAQTSEGVFPGVLTGPLHQNRAHKYNLLSKLSNYTAFGVTFNSVTKKHGGIICTPSRWQKISICKQYEIITVPAEAAEAIIIQAAVKVVLALQPEWAVL